MVMVMRKIPKPLPWSEPVPFSPWLTTRRANSASLCIQAYSHATVSTYSQWTHPIQHMVYRPTAVLLCPHIRNEHTLYSTWYTGLQPCYCVHIFAMNTPYTAHGIKAYSHAVSTYSQWTHPIQHMVYRPTAMLLCPHIRIEPTLYSTLYSLPLCVSLVRRRRLS
jgi:hypothetical protein